MTTQAGKIQLVRNACTSARQITVSIPRATCCLLCEQYQLSLHSTHGPSHREGSTQSPVSCRCCSGHSPSTALSTSRNAAGSVPNFCNDQTAELFFSHNAYNAMLGSVLTPLRERLRGCFFRLFFKNIYVAHVPGSHSNTLSTEPLFSHHSTEQGTAGTTSHQKGNSERQSSPRALPSQQGTPRS